MVEGARLESVYTLIAYRGFESLSLRHFYIHGLKGHGYKYHVSGFEPSIVNSRFDERA